MPSGELSSSDVKKLFDGGIVLELQVSTHLSDRALVAEECEQAAVAAVVESTELVESASKAALNLIRLTSSNGKLTIMMSQIKVKIQAIKPIDKLMTARYHSSCSMGTMLTSSVVGKEVDASIT